LSLKTIAPLLGDDNLEETPRLVTQRQNLFQQLYNGTSANTDHLYIDPEGNLKLE